jgi:hypothetical protein
MGIPHRNVRRVVKRFFALAFATLMIWFVAMTWSVVRMPMVPELQPLVIHDVSLERWA